MGLLALALLFSAGEAHEFNDPFFFSSASIKTTTATFNGLPFKSSSDAALYSFQWLSMPNP